ncbi:hypothetical protein GGR56DRAFT_23932 [Xylariaceae sp. FL0804]|nr:hypothetical protein GGR56DRAFT_23932 [Xylariaceae sp. FL0804]
MSAVCYERYHPRYHLQHGITTAIRSSRQRKQRRRAVIRQRRGATYTTGGRSLATQTVSRSRTSGTCVDMDRGLTGVGGVARPWPPFSGIEAWDSGAHAPSCPRIACVRPLSPPLGTLAARSLCLIPSLPISARLVMARMGHRRLPAEDPSVPLAIRRWSPTTPANRLSPRPLWRVEAVPSLARGQSGRALPRRGGPLVKRASPASARSCLLPFLPHPHCVSLISSQSQVILFLRRRPTAVIPA